MQQTDNSSYYPEQHNTFDFKKFFYKIVQNWYWFAISIFLGLIIAWLYNLYSAEEYSIHSSLIVNEYETGIKRLSLTQNNNNDRNVNVLGQDHAGRLKSHLISLNTLISLGWNIS